MSVILERGVKLKKKKKAIIVSDTINGLNNLGKNFKK